MLTLSLCVVNNLSKVTDEKYMLSDASLPMPSKIKWFGAVKSKGNLSIKVSKVTLASHCNKGTLLTKVIF